MNQKDAGELALALIPEIGSLSKVAQLYDVNKGQLHRLINDPGYKPEKEFRRKLGIRGKHRPLLDCKYDAVKERARPVVAQLIKEHELEIKGDSNK